MGHLIELAVHNSLFALVMALLVFGLTRFWCDPPAAHLLWLLVLLKLVAPPILSISWSVFRLPESIAVDSLVITETARVARPMLDEPPLVDHWAARIIGQDRVAKGDGLSRAAVSHQLWMSLPTALLACWLCGVCGFALISIRRIIRFERMLRGTLPASTRMQRLAFEIARKLGIPRVPAVRYLEGLEVPLLWCAGRRPTILLPIRPISQLDEHSLALILTHELAHLRRRDHWVRTIELIISTVYWWNPLVWMIRRQIHESEELCCDAWVRWAFPDSTKRYAEVVLKAAESLNTPQVGVGGCRQAHS